MDDAIRQALLLHQRWLDGESDGVQADISGVDMTGEDLASWDFRRIIARQCVFVGARMPARMQDGDFAGSDFRTAFMDRNNVAGTNFTNCDMRGADVYYTVIINNATIVGAKFNDSSILWILDILLGVDFTDNSQDIQAMADALKTARAAVA